MKTKAGFVLISRISLEFRIKTFKTLLLKQKN